MVVYVTASLSVSDH